MPVSKRMSRVLVVATVAVGALSLWILTTAVLDAIVIDRLLADGVATTGRIIHVDENHVRLTTRWETGVESTYVAAVRFTDESGVSHEVSSDGTSSPVTNGERVDVYYPRGDPAQARAFVSSPWGKPRTLAFLAAVIGVLAFVCYAASRIVLRKVR